jgi:hypothetical protein
MQPLAAFACWDEGCGGRDFDNEWNVRQHAAAQHLWGTTCSVCATCGLCLPANEYDAHFRGAFHRERSGQHKRARRLERFEQDVEEQDAGGDDAFENGVDGAAQGEGSAADHAVEGSSDDEAEGRDIGSTQLFLGNDVRTSVSCGGRVYEVPTIQESRGQSE